MNQLLSFIKDTQENTNSTLTVQDRQESRLFDENISDLISSLNYKHQSMICYQNEETMKNQKRSCQLKSQKFSIKIKKSFKQQKQEKFSGQYQEGASKNIRKKPTQTKLSVKYENYIKKKLKVWNQKTTQRFLRSSAKNQSNTNFCQIIQYSYQDAELSKISKQKNLKVYDLFRAKVTNFLLSQSEVKQLMAMKKKKLFNRRFIQISD